MRGYFGIGIEHGKTRQNLGTLWRSAKIFGADFIFTVGRRYDKQASDTLKTWRHIPLYHYRDVSHLHQSIPFGCKLIGVEIDANATILKDFNHPERAIYLLGAEDHGLTHEAFLACHDLIQIEGKFCLNVAVAGSIVMYDRLIKR